MSEQRLRWEMTRGARRAVVFLFVLSVVLSAASFAAASYQADKTASARAAAAQAEAAVAQAEAAAARAQQMALCWAGNESRAQQVGLWEYIIHLSGPATSPRQQKVRAEFVRHLRVVFAPRDCAALGKKPPP